MAHVLFDEKWLREYSRRTGIKVPELLMPAQPRLEALTGKEHEAIHGMPQPTRKKYGNRRVEIDGMRFDSQHEADYYFGVLVPRMKAGELKCVLRQVGFDLPGGIRYFADFVAVDQENRITVYDAKSEITKKNRVYINKKKQLLACWGIEIEEV